SRTTPEPSGAGISSPRQASSVPGRSAPSLPPSKGLRCARHTTPKRISRFSNHSRMHNMSRIEAVAAGDMGRVAYGRIAPNEDLVQAVEKLCLMQGFRNAFVRGGLGSLVDACLGTRDGQYRQIRGPAVEIVSIAGEVRTDANGVVEAALAGVVADTDG